MVRPRLNSRTVFINTGLVPEPSCRRRLPLSDRRSGLLDVQQFADCQRLLAVGIFAASAALAELTTVGAVDKVQARVDATQAGQTRPLVVNSDVYFSDRCHSREGARLQATLKDGTQLMLGEHATFVVDEFI
jgi:hypothetical protein